MYLFSDEKLLIYSFISNTIYTYEQKIPNKYMTSTTKKQLSAGWPIDLSADIPIFPPFFTILFSLIVPICITYFMLGFENVAIWDENNITWHFRMLMILLLVIPSIMTVRISDNALKSGGSGAAFTEVNGLVTDIFPYNWTRNPMYTGLTFWICPIIALLINNLLSLTLGFLIIFIYHNNIVIAREEKLLKSIFGKRYEDYCRKVNRWGIF